MDNLLKLLIVMTCIAAYEPFSLDRMLLEALDVNVTDDSGKTIASSPYAENDRSDTPWNDFRLNEMKDLNQTFVNLEIDVIMTREDAEAVYTARDFRSRRKRSAVRDKSKLWPRRIPYTIEDKFSDEDELVIRDAIQQVMQFTCLEFVPKQKKDFNFIQFKSHEKGCLSFVGKQDFPQWIFLGPKCIYRNIIIHEIGHSIGLFHEQSRPDRDKYVMVNESNIREGHQKDFDKGNWTHMSNYSKPYDYLSIMHYSKDLFSIDWRNGFLTLIPTNKRYLDKIGYSQTLSFLDAKIINAMYQCSSGCAPKVCPENGYLGKNCDCYCPSTEGPDPVVLCTHQMYCEQPDMDPTIYLLYDNSEAMQPINNPDKEFLNGTKVHAGFLDFERCGFDMTEYNCINGTWSGQLPTCDFASCKIPTSWKAAGGNGFKDGIMIHKTNITLSCKRRKVLITCSDGVLMDGDKIIDTNKSACGRARGDPTYRVVRDGGKPCAVKYNNKAKYTIRQDGNELINGEIVSHLTEVTATCDDPDLKGEFEAEDLEVFMMCLDGSWDVEAPTRCPKVRKPCSLVTHAVVSGPLPQSGNDKDFLLDHVYNVKCQPGYTLTSTSSKVRCTFEGEWRTDAPFCEPNSCEVPNRYRGTLTIADDGENVLPGSKVKHGKTVTIGCPRGHVVYKESITCNLGNWDTKSKKLPVCKKVVCRTGKGPVKGMKYTYKKEYIYGDTITVNRCPGNLELNGPNTVTCGRNKRWSGKIECRKFCKDGTSRFKVWGSKEMIAAPKREINFGTFSIDACKKECEKEKNFLCRAASYAFVSDRGVICYIYDEKIVSENESLRQSKGASEVQERICID